eukprot:g1345.t1
MMTNTRRGIRGQVLEPTGTFSLTKDVPLVSHAATFSTKVVSGPGKSRRHWTNRAKFKSNRVQYTKLNGNQLVQRKYGHLRARLSDKLVVALYPIHVPREGDCPEPGAFELELVSWFPKGEEAKLFWDEWVQAAEASSSTAEGEAPACAPVPATASENAAPVASSSSSSGTSSGSSSGGVSGTVFGPQVVPSGVGASAPAAATTPSAVPDPIEVEVEVPAFQEKPAALDPLPAALNPVAELSRDGPGAVDGEEQSQGKIGNKKKKAVASAGEDAAGAEKLASEGEGEGEEGVDDLEDQVNDMLFENVAAEELGDSVSDPTFCPTVYPKTPLYSFSYLRGFVINAAVVVSYDPVASSGKQGGGGYVRALACSCSRSAHINLDCPHAFAESKRKAGQTKTADAAKVEETAANGIEEPEANEKRPPGRPIGTTIANTMARRETEQQEQQAGPAIEKRRGFLFSPGPQVRPPKKDGLTAAVADELQLHEGITLGQPQVENQQRQPEAATTKPRPKVSVRALSVQVYALRARDCPSRVAKMILSQWSKRTIPLSIWSQMGCGHGESNWRHELPTECAAAKKAVEREKPEAGRDADAAVAPPASGELGFAEVVAGVRRSGGGDWGDNDVALHLVENSAAGAGAAGALQNNAGVCYRGHYKSGISYEMMTLALQYLAATKDAASSVSENGTTAQTAAKASGSASSGSAAGRKGTAGGKNSCSTNGTSKNTRGMGGTSMATAALASSSSSGSAAESVKGKGNALDTVGSSKRVVGSSLLSRSSRAGCGNGCCGAWVDCEPCFWRCNFWAEFGYVVGCYEFCNSCCNNCCSFDCQCNDGDSSHVDSDTCPANGAYNCKSCASSHRAVDERKCRSRCDKINNCDSYSDPGNYKLESMPSPPEWCDDDGSKSAQWCAEHECCKKRPVARCCRQSCTALTVGSGASDMCHVGGGAASGYFLRDREPAEQCPDTTCDTHRDKELCCIEACQQPHDSDERFKFEADWNTVLLAQDFYPGRNGWQLSPTSGGVTWQCRSPDYSGTPEFRCHAAGDELETRG